MSFDRQEIENEIIELELRLQKARGRLQDLQQDTLQENCLTYSMPPHTYLIITTVVSIQLTCADNFQSSPYIHSLLLVSDSALPLGSFAYSSGLESFLAHQKASPQLGPPVPPIVAFRQFLKLSISSVSRSSLPYLLAAYRSPTDLETLDNDLDASTPCTVARRASVAQGRALLGVWEKSFRASYTSQRVNIGGDHLDLHAQTAVTTIEKFSDALKAGGFNNDLLGPNGHLAPLWGVVCAAMGIDISLTAYTFMLNHAKAVLSAAVRASVMGPYQAQSILASEEMQNLIDERVRLDFNTRPEDAGQVAPVLDLWLGRHELLYSRIFNS